MSAPTLKEPTDSDPGDATKWGAPDAVHCAKLIKGTHATEKIPEAAIKNTAMTLDTSSQVVTGSKLFNNTVLQINNPATTSQYIVNSSAISANRNITLPLLVADDTFVFANFIQTLTNKTIDADQNTISNIENADIKAGAGIVYSKLTLTNSILDADINSSAAISGSKLATALGSHDIDALIFGLPTVEISIASGALAATRSAIIVDSEGAGTTDTLDTITGLSDGDVVALYAKAGETITVTHDFGGIDSIHLRHKINIILSEKTPLVLQRKDNEWYELAGPEITKIALYFGKPSDALAVGDNQANHFMDMKGKLIKVKAVVDTASTSGTPTFAIRKNSTDMLSTNITIDINENSSETAATPPVIKSDGSEIAVKDDVIRCDCDVAGTGTTGAIVYLWFENLSDE